MQHYHHVSLQHKSFIDHVFISQELKRYIRNFTILEDALNTSDHLPVGFFLNVVGVDTVVSSAKSNVIRDFRWDKG